MIAFFFKQFDLFDVEEITDAMGNMPDWKIYMLTGEWPWSVDKQYYNDGDDDDNEMDKKVVMNDTNN
ncbi:unnamed protein product [Schistosoma mattheei]|nr:unnamed protein product [Schistosoma mattheei]